jgi:hypothetical protein
VVVLGLDVLDGDGAHPFAGQSRRGLWREVSW